MAEFSYGTGGRSELPWSASAREDRQFGLIAVVITSLFLALGLILPTIEVPEIERAEAEKVPPQLARLVERPKPVTPPEVSIPEPEPRPEPPPEQKPAPEPEPSPPVAQTSPTPKPEVKPSPKPVQTAEQAREKASKSGLLAMKDRLAALRAPAQAAPEVLRANTAATASAAPERVSASQVTQGSGGVVDAEAPETSVAVQGHQVKSVEPAQETLAKAEAPTPAAPSVGERAMSNIRKVFDAQKTALYSLYRRELRQDPTLEGKLLLELVIEPDGSVSACQVVSSELDNPPLEQRIAMRVRLFDFGADNVEARKVRFPIDFLPG